MSIGLFDSGIGGLTICRAISDRLPTCDIAYLADQAHVPYGTRSGEEIVRLTQVSCERLVQEGCNLIVLACNTASAIALRTLQQDWLPQARQHFGRALNVLGIIVPTIEMVTGLPWHEQSPTPNPTATEAIGVFATRATARSAVFEVEILKRQPAFRVTTEACPNLASLVESDAGTSILSGVIEQHVNAMHERCGGTLTKAILGCTHYEVVVDLFYEHLPPDVTIIRQPQPSAESLAKYVSKHPEYDVGTRGLRRFLTTGFAPDSVTRYWGQQIEFERV